MWSVNGQLGQSRFCFIHLGLQSFYIFAVTSIITAAVSCVSVCRLYCASLVSPVCCVVSVLCKGRPVWSLCYICWTSRRSWRILIKGLWWTTSHQSICSKQWPRNGRLLMLAIINVGIDLRLVFASTNMRATRETSCFNLPSGHHIPLPLFAEPFPNCNCVLSSAA